MLAHLVNGKPLRLLSQRASMKRLAILAFSFAAAFAAVPLVEGCSGAADGGSPNAVPAPPPVADAAPVCTPIAAATETLRVKGEIGTLEGTLEIPEGCGPMPLVVIVSG